MLSSQLENMAYTSEADEQIRPIKEHLEDSIQARAEAMSTSSKVLHQEWDKSVDLVRRHAELVAAFGDSIEANEPGSASAVKEVGFVYALYLVSM